MGRQRWDIHWARWLSPELANEAERRQDEALAAISDQFAGSGEVEALVRAEYPEARRVTLGCYQGWFVSDGIFWAKVAIAGPEVTGTGERVAYRLVRRDDLITRARVVASWHAEESRP